MRSATPLPRCTPTGLAATGRVKGAPAGGHGARVSREEGILSAVSKHPIHSPRFASFQEMIPSFGQGRA